MTPEEELRRWRMAVREILTELLRLEEKADRETRSYDEYHPGKREAYDWAQETVKDAIAKHNLSLSDVTKEGGE